jgi:hypothetical protein
MSALLNSGRSDQQEINKLTVRFRPQAVFPFERHNRQSNNCRMNLSLWPDEFSPFCGLIDYETFVSSQSRVTDFSTSRGVHAIAVLDLTSPAK